MMTLCKNLSLSYEVFQKMHHWFGYKFCSGVSSFGIILVQTFFIYKFSVKIRRMDYFPKPSASDIVITVIWQSLSMTERIQ